MTITRPAVNYFGGKYALGPWVISHFPTHTCYVEPYCGGASVFFRKTPSRIEVINDIDQDVVVFFRMLRERHAELVQLIKLTPYSRVEYFAAWEATDTEADLERARKFYVRSWQGWGSLHSRRSGWLTQKTMRGGKLITAVWDATAHLKQLSKRLKNAFIECDDALAVVARYDTPDTLFYCDPPYLSGERRPNSYLYEMDVAGHSRLLDALRKVQGMVVISGYQSPLYAERLAAWQRYTTTARTVSHGKMSTETLWMSPLAVQKWHGQLWNRDELKQLEVKA